jgi:hypothetical protein
MKVNKQNLYFFVLFLICFPIYRTNNFKINLLETVSSFTNGESF